METVTATAHAMGGASAIRLRANSRRGETDTTQHSYPPIEAVQRAFEVLRTVNRLRIATVSKVHAATGIPKPTVVRMLETLIADGYVARDNMCGGYRVTSRTRELNSGYDGISFVIEASRPLAIDLTRRTKFPVGIGTFDGEAIALQFWTGTISPLAHTNTVLGLRPDLISTAMGRAYLAFCPEEERKHLFARFRNDRSLGFSPEQETFLLHLLKLAREDGYAMRDPRTEPRRMTTVAMPIRSKGLVLALTSITFFSSVVPRHEVVARVVDPLREMIDRIEKTIAFMQAEQVAPCPSML